MKTIYDVIKTPVITEKSAYLMETENTYTFEVSQGANKIEIRNAVENIFDVKVESVNVINVRAKKKRVGRYVGKTARVRKAMVKLADGNKIDIF